MPEIIDTIAIKVNIDDKEVKKDLSKIKKDFNVLEKEFNKFGGDSLKILQRSHTFKGISDFIKNAKSDIESISKSKNKDDIKNYKSVISSNINQLGNLDNLLKKYNNKLGSILKSRLSPYTWDAIVRGESKDSIFGDWQEDTIPSLNKRGKMGIGMGIYEPGELTSSSILGAGIGAGIGAKSSISSVLVDKIFPSSKNWEQDANLFMESLNKASSSVALLDDNIKKINGNIQQQLESHKEEVLELKKNTFSGEWSVPKPPPIPSIPPIPFTTVLKPAKINISSVEAISNIQRVKNALNGLKDKLVNINISQKINGIRNNINSQFGQFGGKIGDMLGNKGSLGRVGKFVGGLGIPLQIGASIYAIQRVSREIKQLTIEAANSQETIAKLENTLKQTGISTGFTSSQLIKTAESLSRLTNFTDDQIINAQILLSTFDRINGVNYDKAIKAALDLSAVYGIELNKSAKILGKVLTDPLKNIKALQRSDRTGISYTEEQKKQIELLINQNKLYEAQKIILDKINSKVGGAAINNANLIKQISIAWGEVRERIGGIFIDLGMTTGLIEGWRNLLNGISITLDNIFNNNKYKDFINGIGVMVKITIDLVQLLADVMFRPFKGWDYKKQQLKDIKDDWNEFEKNINNNQIPKLFKDIKTPDGIKDSVPTLDKAKNKAKELKDTLKDAFNIGDISNWWDTFLQGTVDTQNRITESLRNNREQFDGSFNNPNSKDVGKILEETNDEQVEAIDESNMWLSKIANNVGVFA